MSSTTRQPGDRQAPTPVQGMKIIDPAYPRTTWRIVQVDDDGVVYLQRERDGHLFHHDRRSWTWCFRNHTLAVVE